jgi:hypothetical protein
MQDLDLKELADRYCELKDIFDDEDEDFFDEAEREEWNELCLLNAELEDLLYYPSQAGDVETVAKGSENVWAEDQANMYEWINTDSPLYHFVNWQDYGEHELQHWPEFTYEGTTYYYNDMR